jgi:hypothetical protein
MPVHQALPGVDARGALRDARADTTHDDRLALTPAGHPA